MQKLRITTFALALAASASTLQAQEGETWVDRISLKGDLRARMEIIDQDGKDTRDRARLRARLEVNGEANEDIDVVLRMNSGNDDPVSGNSTLGSGFSKKEFSLDLAYIDWHPAAAEGLSLWLGKFRKPYVVTKDILWDGDLNPEGAAAIYTLGGDGLELNLNGSAQQLVERSSESNTMIYTGQASADIALGEASLLTGVGYFYFDNVKGQDVVFDEFDGFGNDVVEVTDEEGEVTGLLYDSEFAPLELFAQFSPGLDIPVKLYASYVNNTRADDKETAYLGGVTLGKAKAPGTYQFDYNYRDLEANSTLGILTDSDSGGGGTNVNGHKVQGKYQFATNWQGAVSLFFNKLDPDGDNTDYFRAQFDLIAKF